MYQVPSNNLQHTTVLQDKVLYWRNEKLQLKSSKNSPRKGYIQNNKINVSGIVVGDHQSRFFPDCPDVTPKSPSCGQTEMASHLKLRAQVMSTAIEQQHQKGPQKPPRPTFWFDRQKVLQQVCARANSKECSVTSELHCSHSRFVNVITGEKILQW